MNVVDSSGWVEYLTGGPSLAAFAGPIADTSRLIVPTVSLYEVFKRFQVMRGDTAARIAAAHMRLGQVVDLDDELAVAAARMSLRHRLPMSDSIILATARRFSATLWTQDADFAGIDDVRYIPKGKA